MFLSGGPSQRPAGPALPLPAAGHHNHQQRSMTDEKPQARLGMKHDPSETKLKLVWVLLQCGPIKLVSTLRTGHVVATLVLLNLRGALRALFGTHLFHPLIKRRIAHIIFSLPLLKFITCGPVVPLICLTIEAAQ